jgi:DHA1 family bicyclomycin/chloramphenicol resistance-like MFS transporter
MLQPLSTDFYLASLPGLTQTFAASVATVQLTLSVFVITFGVMQLFIGPLSDRLGRVPVTTAGIALYAAASVACALAPSIELLILARLFQAIGCCTVVVVARAIIRDVFDPLAGARVMAQASTLLAIGPLLGPILGSFLEVRYGFRATFAVLAVFAGALLVATLLTLSETNAHRDRNATRAGPLLRNCALVLRSRHFVAYALVGAASYGGLFAFISGSSFVLIRVLGVPTSHFGYGFAFCVSGYLVGTIVCPRLLARHGIVGTLKRSACVSAAGGLAMATLAVAGVLHWAAVLVPQFVCMLAHGINFPCSQAGAVAPFPRQAGAAAGVLGFLTMALAGLVGWWMGVSNNGTVYPLAFTVAGSGLAVFAAVWGYVARLPRPAPAG